MLINIVLLVEIFDLRLHITFNSLILLVLLYCVGTCKPLKIFLEYFGDICEAIRIKLLPVINLFLATRLISFDLKNDVQSMSDDAYDKAEKVVNKLQRQVKEKGIDFFKVICDSLLNQNHALKDIGIRMKCQLQSKRLYCKTVV